LIIFVDLGFVTASIVKDILNEAQGQDSVSLEAAVPDPDAIALVPKALAKRSMAVPVNFDTSTNTLNLAINDIYNVMVLDRVRAVLPAGIKLHPVLSTDAEIQTALDTFYGYELSVEGILKEIETGIVERCLGYSL